MNPVVKVLMESAPAPIKRGDLIRLLKMRDRDVRELIEQARKSGWMIENNCDGRGYYLASPKQWDEQEPINTFGADGENLDQMVRNYKREYSRMRQTAIVLNKKRSFLRAAGCDI